jgi:hypothetical protein
MNNRTTGIILTVLAGLLFGCPGLACLCSGLITAIAGLSSDPYYYFGIDTEPGAALVVGLSLICLSVILIAIPIIVGVITIRGKAQTAGDEVITIDSQAFEPDESELPTDQEKPEEDIPPAI